MIELITGFENVDAFIKNKFELLQSKGVRIEIFPDRKVSIDEISPVSFKTSYYE